MPCPSLRPVIGALLAGGSGSRLGRTSKPAALVRSVNTPEELAEAEALLG